MPRRSRAPAHPPGHAYQSSGSFQSPMNHLQCANWTGIAYEAAECSLTVGSRIPPPPPPAHERAATHLFFAPPLACQTGHPLPRYHRTHPFFLFSIIWHYTASLSTHCCSPPTAAPLMYPNCSSAFTPYLVRTLHGYHHSSPSSASAHLAFDPDQLILVITKHASGWWDGELVLDGKRGWFPGHYVEAVKAAEPEGATPPPPYEVCCLRRSGEAGSEAPADENLFFWVLKGCSGQGGWRDDAERDGGLGGVGDGRVRVGSGGVGHHRRRSRRQASVVNIASTQPAAISPTLIHH